MPKPMKRAPVKSSSKTSTAAKQAKAKTAKAPKRTRAAKRAQAEDAAYLEMLIRTGQAVPAGRGKLPPGVTHELVPDARGKVKAVRRRFSIA